MRTLILVMLVATATAYAQRKNSLPSWIEQDQMANKEKAIREAKEAEQAQLDRQKADPKAMAVAYSVNFCFHYAAYQDAIEAIQEERKRARIGGVIDLALLHDWQNQAANEAVEVKKWKRIIAAKKLPLLKCYTPAVAKCIKKWCISETDCEYSTFESDCEFKDLVGFVGDTN